MDQLRRIMASINKQLRPMSVSAKVAVFALALVLVLLVVLVIQNTGKPDMRELYPGMPAAEQVSIKDRLDALGIKNRLTNGKVYIAPDDAAHAKAALAQAGALPNDKAMMFES